MSESDNDNGRLAPETHEIDPAAEMEALRAREPLKVDLAREILEEMGKTVGFNHDIKFENGEFVLVASRQINDAQVLKGEVARAATLEAMLDCVIANDGYRLWDSTPANKNAAEAGREEIRAGEGPMTVEAIERDPWNAIVRDLPENGPRELYVAAAEAAHMLRSMPHAERPAPPFPLPTDDVELSALGDEIKTRMKEADSKIHEIDVAAGRAEILGMVDAEDRASVEQRIAAYQPVRGEFASLDAFMSATEHLAEHTEAMRIRDGEDAAVIMPTDLKSDLFSLGVALSQMVDGLAYKVETALWSASRIGEGVGLAVENALGSVFSFFAGEPGMTPQQVHDTLQSAGNVEAQHAREVAAAAAVESAAHDFRMMVAKGEQETRNVYLGMEAGTNATAEATLGLDAYEPQRRKQSQSQSF